MKLTENVWNGLNEIKNVNIKKCHATRDTFFDIRVALEPLIFCQDYHIVLIRIQGLEKASVAAAASQDEDKEY